MHENQHVRPNVQNSKNDNNKTAKNFQTWKPTVSQHSIVIPNKSFCHSNVLIPMDENKKLESEMSLSFSIKELKIDINSTNFQSLFPSWGHNMSQLYEFQIQLGSGCSGDVHKVKSISGNVRACKILDKIYSRNNEFMAEIKKEVQILKKCKHQNIVTFYEGFETRRFVYLILELLAGPSLNKTFNRYKPLPDQTCIMLTKQILSALNYLHENLMIHCDIKPANIMYLHENGNLGLIKLIDFGISMNKKTKTSVFSIYAHGTPGYIAPECLGKYWNEAIDIWSLGVTLFEMLFGYVPFDGDDDNFPDDSYQKTLVGFDSSMFLQEINGDHHTAVSCLAKNFILKCLDSNVKTRISVFDALQHKWLKTYKH